MWLMLNDCFFSIVQKDCGRDEVLVRARRKGDIEKVWPKAKVIRGELNDYLYRARIAKEEVKRALALEVDRVTYSNFKDSVADPVLHRAYSRVWGDMLAVEEKRPGYPHSLFAGGELAKLTSPPSALAPLMVGRRRKRRRKRSLRGQ